MMRLGLLVAALVFIADQAVKAGVLYGLGFIHCAPCRSFVTDCRICPPMEILPMFNLTMVWNYGISFGLFPADSGWERALLIGFAVVVTGILCVWLARVQDRLLAVAIGLIIGGAIGNVLDRLVYGAVADFFDFHLFGYHWYVFNIADAAIVVGVAAVLWDALVHRPDAGPAGGNTTEK